MNFNDLILLLDSRSENLKQLASMEIPFRVDNDGGEFYKTKDGYRVEYPNGNCGWYLNNGLLHRIDGPAWEYANGRKYWIVNGKQMTEKQFNKWRAKNNPIKESRAENLKHLASMEVPYRVDEDGTEYYKTKDGYRHEDINGFKAWYNAKGKLHRLDGPAIEYVNGSKSWWVNGEQMMSEGQFNRRRAWMVKNNLLNEL
jgi:hypothetical protein